MDAPRRAAHHQALATGLGRTFHEASTKLPQAHATGLGRACTQIYAAGGVRGFFAGLFPRSVSLAGGDDDVCVRVCVLYTSVFIDLHRFIMHTHTHTGSLFVLPFSIETLQPALRV